MCINPDHHSPSAPLLSTTEASREKVETAGCSDLGSSLVSSIPPRQVTLSRKDEALRLRMIVWLTRHGTLPAAQLHCCSLQVLRTQIVFVESLSGAEFREDSVR